MKVRCPNCKALLQIPDPPPKPPPEPRGVSLLDDILGGLRGCNHPENVKINGKCLACERERKYR